MASRFCTPAHYVPQSTEHCGCQSVRWGRWAENAGHCFRLYGKLPSAGRLFAWPGVPIRQVGLFAQWLPGASIRRTSENSVKAKFARPTRVVWRRLRKGARVERRRRNGPAPPPSSAGPPQWRIVSGGSGPRLCTFRAIAARAGPKGHTKRPAAQEGEVRAAGPDNSSLPDCVQAKHRGRSSKNNPSTHLGE